MVSKTPAVMLTTVFDVIGGKKFVSEKCMHVFYFLTAETNELLINTCDINSPH